MRVFLDACIDPRVVEAFIRDEVRTAFDLVKLASPQGSVAAVERAQPGEVIHVGIPPLNPF